MNYFWSDLILFLNYLLSPFLCKRKKNPARISIRRGGELLLKSEWMAVLRLWIEVLDLWMVEPGLESRARICIKVSKRDAQVIGLALKVIFPQSRCSHMNDKDIFIHDCGIITAKLLIGLLPRRHSSITQRFSPF